MAQKSRRSTRYAMRAAFLVLGCTAIGFTDLPAQNPPAGSPPAAQPQAQGRGGGGGRGGVRVMTLTSTAFTDGGQIPAKYAQPGHDVSPPLSWSGGPDSVVSYVLIVHDADAVIGNGLDDVLHWMVWNIPGSAMSLPEGMPQGPTIATSVAAPATGGRGGGPGAAGMRQLSVSGPYYRGPAAPSSGPPHHYIFELYALDAMVNVQPVGMSAAATRAAVMEAMAGRIRGKATLVGTFRRAAP